MLESRDMLSGEAAGICAESASARRYHWKAVRAFFDAIPLEEIDADAVQAFVVARRKKGIRGQTIRRELNALKRGLVDAHRKAYLHAPNLGGKMTEHQPMVVRGNSIGGPNGSGGNRSLTPKRSERRAKLAELLAANALPTGKPNPFAIVGQVEAFVSCYSGEPLMLGEAIEDLVFAACEVEKTADREHGARESMRRAWESNPWR